MDEKKDPMDDVAMEEENFAELLKESLVKPVRYEVGQKVKGRVVTVTDECVFLDLGGKSEGCLDKKDLLDEDGSLSVREGDLVQAYFLSSGDEGIRLTMQISGSDAGRRHLEDAWRSGIPIEGLVEKEIKGGYEVKIVGGLRGFCPFSQMGLQRAADPNEPVGRHLPFRITQYDERGRNIVLSNRAVLEEEREREREEQKEALREGMKLKAKVTSLHNFGAFIRIGSLDGLIPISEIGWERVEDITQVLTVGQEVEVVATKLDWEKNRLTFSLRKTIQDPWDNVESNFPSGSVHTGTVARLTNFGAFVTLGPGVDGLLHISKLGAGKRIKHPSEVVDKGRSVEVRIESVDRENKRISLALAASQTAEGEVEPHEDYSKYLEPKPGSMGTLADLLKAKTSNRKRK